MMQNGQRSMVLVTFAWRQLVQSCRLVLMAALTVGLLACGSKDPQNALEEAARQLEENIKNQQTSAVMQQLHTDFLAQQHYGRQEIRQQMLGLFMRYKSINILVLNRDCQLDKGFYDRGLCTAQVGITGAQRLIPERAEHYRVSSVWQLNDKKWQLLQLNWQ